MWNNELELKFIEHFQAEPILWDTKHRHYKDKSLNHDAWNRLGELMDKPVPELKKKKESLFASYRKYRKLVKDSSRSGAGGNEVYKPIWFAYYALDLFLSDGLTVKKTIHTTSNTEESGTPTIDEETIAENRVIEETRNEIKSTPTTRPRSLQCEVKEAGKHMKEAISLFQQSLKKRESESGQDDCDIYSLGLAKKLRAFSEEERLEIMYDIDGMIINRRRAKRLNKSTTTFIPSPSPSPYSQCPSSRFSYSDTSSREDLYNQNASMPYSEATQIHVPQEQHTQQTYFESSTFHLPRDTDAETETGSNVRIISVQSLRGGPLSDIIAQAYDTA